jgi:hypothetical protein
VEYRYIYFPHVFSATFHASLAFMFIYCTYRFILAKTITLQIPHCNEWRSNLNSTSLNSHDQEKCFRQMLQILMIYAYNVSANCSYEEPLFYKIDKLNLTIEFTPWSRLLQKPRVTQLVKKFTVSYGTRRFITVFTRTRHWYPSWSRCTQSTTSHPISLRSILILSSHLHLGFPRILCWLACC